MTWFSVAVLCAFLLFKEYIHVSSTGSEKSLQILQLPRNITKEARDGERRFHSPLDNPEQVQRGFIEDKFVTTGKSVDDGNTFENDNLSPGDRKQTTHNFDNILKSFDAKVEKLERKLRSESNIVLYSSQETQNRSTGITPENEVNTTEVLSVVSEKISTKAVDSAATSSSIGKPSLSSSQTVSTVSFTFISTTKGEISPTPSSSLHSMKQTAGAFKTTASSVSITFKTTPSPSISLSTVGGNVSLTNALDHSPVLGDVTPSISDIVKAHATTHTTVLSYSSIIAVEGKLTTGQPFSTKTSRKKSDSISTSIELLAPKAKPTEASTANDKEEIQGKSKTNQPNEKKKGLFRNLSIEILIALVAGALCALLLLAFLVYRLKKRNEGSYDLSETLYMKIRTQDELRTKKEVFV